MQMVYVGASEMYCGFRVLLVIDLVSHTVDAKRTHSSFSVICDGSAFRENLQLR